MAETTRPTHLSPTPFLALEDARIALDAARDSIIDARIDLDRLEKRAATFLLSADQDIRDLLADFAVNALARHLHCAEHGYSMDQAPEVAKAWGELVEEKIRLEELIIAMGDQFQRAREAARSEDAKKGVAA